MSRSPSRNAAWLSSTPRAPIRETIRTASAGTASTASASHATGRLPGSGSGSASSSPATIAAASRRKTTGSTASSQPQSIDMPNANALDPATPAASRARFWPAAASVRRTPSTRIAADEAEEEQDAHQAELAGGLEDERVGVADEAGEGPVAVPPVLERPRAGAGERVLAHRLERRVPVLVAAVAARGVEAVAAGRRDLGVLELRPRVARPAGHVERDHGDDRDHREHGGDDAAGGPRDGEPGEHPVAPDEHGRHPQQGDGGEDHDRRRDHLGGHRVEVPRVPGEARDRLGDEVDDRLALLGEGDQEHGSGRAEEHRHERGQAAGMEGEEHGEGDAGGDRPAAGEGEEERQSEQRERRGREGARDRVLRLGGEDEYQREPDRHQRRQPVPVVERVVEPRPDGLVGGLVGGEERRVEAREEGEAGDDADRGGDAAERSGGCRPCPAS